MGWEKCVTKTSSWCISQLRMKPEITKSGKHGILHLTLNLKAEWQPAPLQVVVSEFVQSPFHFCSSIQHACDQ